MNCVDRYKEYKDEGLDLILLKIKSGEIKAGRYANMIKIEKGFKIDEGSLFGSGNQS